jgi:membrane associated rhomboid family serine protease
MGIQDRDYYRDGTGGPPDVWGRQGVVVWVIAITCGVFLGQFITGDPVASPLVRLGEFQPVLILQGEVWRLFTPLLLHGGILHLLFNMLVLYWAGKRMEEDYGSREFLAFYLVAGLFAHTVYLLAYVFDLTPAVRAVGASGAVTGVFVLFACRYPHQTVRLNFILPVPAWLLVIVYVGLDVLGAVQGAIGMRTAPIGYFAHLGGAAFALLYFRSRVRISHLLARPRAAQRVRPKLRVVPAAEPEEDTPAPVGAAVESPPRPKEAAKEPKEAADEQLEARLDQVLEKVSKYGQESLTPEEREILFRASELYKKRRK